MSETKNIESPVEKDQIESDSNLAASRSNVSDFTSKESVKSSKITTTAERQIKFERAQKCLENAALVSKRIKEHRKATAELLGRPFDDDNADNQSELASAVSERTGYSVATDTSTTLSVQDALNIPGISESLANTLKQKEILMERIKQYKEISKRPMKTSPLVKKEVTHAGSELRKGSDKEELSKLLNTVKEKENAVSIMQVKMKAMETTILDLQEKINEKDQIIEAKNKATTLISDSLTKKEKDTLDLLEDTKKQMTLMQQNFIAMESEWKEEKSKLLDELKEKDEKLKSLTEANSILENSRFEITIANSKLIEELDMKSQEIAKLEEKLSEIIKVSEAANVPEEKEEIEKGSKEISDMAELTKKIELLEHLNYQLRQTNKELELQLSSQVKDTKPIAPTTSSPSKKGSPMPSRKGRNTASKMKSPWSKLSTETLNQEQEKKSLKSETPKSEKLLQALNKDLLEKECIISQKEEVILELQMQNDKKETLIEELKLQLQDTPEYVINKVDIGVCTEKISEQTVTENVSDFGDVNILMEKLKEAQNQVTQLNEEIDTANKNMVKVKSNFKLKIKQMQKTIDNFSKVSDANAEIVRLNEEIHQLSQKVAELEEEKGNLQLHLVDYDSGRLTDTDVYKKMVEMENLADARLKSISLLEAQKFDLVQELHVLQQKNSEMEDKLADISQLQNEHVCSEMKSVQLEEQIDQLSASKKELELVIDNLKLDKQQIEENNRVLQSEKDELAQKLEHYIQENMELTEKLEKVCGEKVSSAESIEIVESLTSQEKLELEKYNKGITAEKVDDNHSDNNDSSSTPEDISLDKLLQENAELKNKIELFTQERQEVMEKMNKITIENNDVQKNIGNLENECRNLQKSIAVSELNEEKEKLTHLNKELNSQLNELKQERIEIIKETADIKTLPTEDVVDASPGESQDDKNIEKSTKGAKSVKQLTKEILKLKNVIKEREDEIADCQMKILSLEEQQQKQTELLESNAAHEIKIKQLSEENRSLKTLIDTATNDKSEETHLKETIENLRSEIQHVQLEYNSAITGRDTKIQELENLLVEYEKQIFSYSNTLQQKDKDINEYVNQITKLNDITQKLKYRIESLEEEKAKDQNIELVKSLNNQIALYQNALADCEEKLRILEDENNKLSSLKSKLESRNITIESELEKTKEILSENQKLVDDLRKQQQKHKEEYAEILNEAKERDEEIHEIKLQLRKESIENEKLRNSLEQKESDIIEIIRKSEELQQKLNLITLNQNSQSDQCDILENKNKELLEKLKKFALTIKKKSAMYSELETQYNLMQKQFEEISVEYEQAKIQLDTLPTLQDKLKHANEEFVRLQSEKNMLDEKYQQTHNELLSLQQRHDEELVNLSKLQESVDLLRNELTHYQEENIMLKTGIETINKKLVQNEIDQKDNNNLLTKISCLEAELEEKQQQILKLTTDLQNQEQILQQSQCGHEAKVQERDMYIENLQMEMDKYKNRICRLEESISAMENRRQSLERKADQLDTQLQEKQKSYLEYTNQEDELVSRLAALMDHDRVLEKQIQELESENLNLNYKLQHLSDELITLQKSYSSLQTYCNDLESKSTRVEFLEAENFEYRSKAESLDMNLRKLSSDYQQIVTNKKTEMDNLESEFNTQIEEAIKEKKILSEKYEKLKEYVEKLECEIKEYKNTIEHLHTNIEEMSNENRTTEQTYESCTKPNVPDYTEQYVSEINRLTAMVNSKDNQIEENQTKIQSLQVSNDQIKSNYETKLNELLNELKQKLKELDVSSKEKNELIAKNADLSSLLASKEEQIKQLIEKKKLVFEMTIPKTEGLTISSTIEELSDDQKTLTSLQSQILSDTEISSREMDYVQKKDVRNVEKPAHSDQSQASIEPLIVPKKAYSCTKSDVTEAVDIDPFNSDEGWGLGESEDLYDITSETAKLNEEIQNLKKSNDVLNQELNVSNNKLLKALKKLKELKHANEMLANELKISKQISNSSMLDMAMQSELSNNVEILEKKVQELNEIIIKDKKDKESILKQNEILKNANDRLLEMKEKMDNEIELWKYNFKIVNDKVLSGQKPHTEVQGTSETQSENICTKKHEVDLQQEIIKLEKENDELQELVDNLTSKNKELSDEVFKLTHEVNNLKQNEKSSECDLLNNRVCELQAENDNLLAKCTTLQQNLSVLEQQYKENLDVNEKLKTEKESQQHNITELTKSNMELLSQIELVKNENEIELLSLKQALENAELRLQQNQQNIDQINEIETLQKQIEDIHVECTTLKRQLDEANKTIQTLELENKSRYDYIDELELKVSKLNLENDQLLSTVTELRSSIASAMDQRGFEIAELWKQHLAQRESEFQALEQDLRMQLNNSESKYEQLLDSVQSSTQEESNKILMLEQVTALQNKLQEKEENLNNLQNKYTDLLHQIEILRSEMEDEKMIHENKILVQQEEYDKIIEELKGKVQKYQEHHESSVELENELTATKSVNDSLNLKIEELNEHYQSKISDLTKEIQLKDSEIFQKTHDYTIALADRNNEFEMVRKQLIEYEKKVEDLTYEKESELAIMRLKMHENSEHYQKINKDLEEEKVKLAEELNAKIIECTNLNQKITDLNKILEEYANKAAETQLVLESQELEIVTLKDEIETMKTAMRAATTKIEKHVTFSSDTKSSVEESHSKELLDAVPRAELDLALYMLHQRDVRCEELTMELTQLLEERDTLQLRLSDSLRSYEELKSRYGNLGLDTSATSSQDTISELPSFSIEKESPFVDTHRAQASRSSSISEPDGEKPKLQAKLSELRSVKQSRDVRLRQDSEQRQLGMRLLQRDVANLPPEAIEHLSQAHHTLSRDSQSTPTVLLNWLRGKSTPKVVHM